MMTLSPIQSSLVSLYAADWFDESGNFKGDDNDLAVVISNACNKMADSGCVEVAFETFMVCTPRNFLPPIETIPAIRADYEQRAAAKKNHEVVDFILSGDIYGGAAPEQTLWTADNQHKIDELSPDAEDARLQAAAAVHAWMNGELQFHRHEDGHVTASPRQAQPMNEILLLQNAKVVSFLLQVIQRENEVGRSTLGSQAAYKSLFRLLTGN